MGDKEFIQIFNVNGNHWIIVSTVRCTPGVVKVYDTMHQNLTPSLKSIVADLPQTKLKFLTIKYVNVQLQKGGYDCGLLSIASATAICYGKEPEHLLFDQDQARKHLEAAYEQKVLLPFPASHVRRKPYILQEKLPIYCSCRQIDDGRHMIICDGCNEWYHINCIKISPKILEDNSRSWFCQQSCSNKGDYTYTWVASEVKLLTVSYYRSVIYNMLLHAYIILSNVIDYVVRSLS